MTGQPMRPDTLLEALGIEASYGRVQVLWGVDLEVRDRETVVLLGATGATDSLGLTNVASDQLLTTLVRMIERSRLGSADGPDAVLSLRPAVDHLLHLWMPTAHVDRSLAPLWEVLEREPGFTRQWQTMVQRVRDQLALHAITLRRDASTART